MPENHKQYVLYSPINSQEIFLSYLTYVLLHKSNKTIWMFYGNFADEGDNQWTSKRI
jgi:hypothetical protein